MPAILLVVAAAAVAVAAYEWWNETPPAAQATGGGMKLALETAPLPVPLPPGALTAQLAAMRVPAARAWVLRVAHAYDISAAGDSLVNAIVLIARSLGNQVVPLQFQQLANYGRITRQDWPIYGGMAPAGYQPNAPGR